MFENKFVVFVIKLHGVKMIDVEIYMFYRLLNSSPGLKINHRFTPYKVFNNLIKQF